MNQIGPSQKAFDYILSQIRNKKWNPGDRISTEMELASLLEISRVSVRQALDQLSAVGLLKKKQGSGTYISKLEASSTIDSLIPLLLMEKEELLKLLEFRKYFETANVEIYIDNIGSNNISELEKTYIEMHENSDKPELFYTADFQFHQLIAEGTKNIFIIKISNILNEVLKSHQAHLYEKIGPDVGLHFHKSIINAIKDKDKELASLLMKRHIQSAIEKCESL